MMETRYVTGFVEKYYYFGIRIPEGESYGGFNRKVRIWLALNCEDGWETEWNDLRKIPDRSPNELGVYFNLDSKEEDMVLFRLTWVD